MTLTSTSLNPDLFGPDHVASVWSPIWDEDRGVTSVHLRAQPPLPPSLHLARMTTYH